MEIDAICLFASQARAGSTVGLDDVRRRVDDVSNRLGRRVKQLSIDVVVAD